MRLQVVSSISTHYWSVTNVAPAKPYLQISNQYLPLTTATRNGIKLKVQSGNTSYRACVYESGYYNTTSAAVGSLSSTTALTRSSVSGYATRSSASGYLTRVSTSGYATRSSTSGYATRSSISGYETRSSISGYATRSSISGYGTSVSTGQTASTTMRTFTYEAIYRTSATEAMDRNGVVRLMGHDTYRARAQYRTTATHPTYGTQVRNNIWVGDYGPDYLTMTDPEANIYHLTDVTALTASHNIMGSSRAAVSMPYGPRLHAAGYMVSGQMGYTSQVTLTNGQTLSSSTWIGNTYDTETRRLTDIMRVRSNTNYTYTFDATTWSSCTTGEWMTVLTESAYIPPGQSWGWMVNRTTYLRLNSTYYPYLTNTYMLLQYQGTASGPWANSTFESTVTWITDKYSNTRTEKATISGGWHVTVSFADIGLPQNTTVSNTVVVTTATLTRASTSATLTRASTSAILTRASTSATLTRASTSATLTRASTSATLTRASTSATLTRASTSGYSGKLSSSSWV